MVWNEDHQKFETNWFGLYKVIKAHPIRTYALETLSGKVLWNLIHDDWLIEAWVLNDDPKAFWLSSGVHKLCEKGHTLKASRSEVDEILNCEKLLPPIYDELAVITQFKWDCTMCDRIHRPLIKKGKEFNLPSKAIWKAWKQVINEQSAIILPSQSFESCAL